MKKREYPKILGVDFDGVLCSCAFPQAGKVKWIHKLIHSYIRFKHAKGWFIIINTCREDERLLPVKTLLHSYDIPYDVINENAFWLIEKYSDCRKISCDIMIDDHNFGLFSWLLRRFS